MPARRRTVHGLITVKLCSVNLRPWYQSSMVQVPGTSSQSWEAAAAAALSEASKTVRDLRVAEVSAFDITLEGGKVKSYRTKLNVSFKVE